MENEYDDGEDTDSDGRHCSKQEKSYLRIADEENRVTDIYPDEDEDPEFEANYGSSSDEGAFFIIFCGKY